MLQGKLTIGLTPLGCCDYSSNLYQFLGGGKMENVILDKKKNGQKKTNSSNKDTDSTEDDSLSERLVESDPVQKILNVRKAQTKIELGLETRIPKHIMFIDEKYIRRCLELIQITAMRAASSNFTKNIDGSSTCALSSFVIECPQPENMVLSSGRDWVLGSITTSKSMINILKSPFFHHLGALENDSNYQTTGSIDIKEPIFSDFTSSPGGLSIASSHNNLKKGDLGFGDQISGVSRHVNRRLFSTSSTNSTCSDQSSSSSSIQISGSQGMLQITRKDGFPRYVFSINGQKEVHVANSFKVESRVDKGVDYVYTLSSSLVGEKDVVVGKMKVSTSFSLCPNGTEVMETQFVLFGCNDNYAAGEVQSSNLNLGRKSTGLSKKVMNALKTNYASKQRVSHESCSWESTQDPTDDLPPNLELAAIVVKDHIRDSSKAVETGGWGLKFLKKVGIKKSNSSAVECMSDSGDCCISMDILLPAGFHGGPRTRHGGPSSLIERWSSGGSCDCGGWDIGCPLTVLNVRANRNNEDSIQPEKPAKWNTFDLFVQGSKRSTPIMNMTNIRDGLYYIHFESSLSALQCLSIAASIIHTYFPALRPKVYRN